MIKSFYPWVLAGMLGIGGFLLPPHEPSAGTAVSQNVVAESHSVLREDAAAIYPLAISLPSDFDTEHVEWCLKRYRSYNPRDNTWVSYSGKVQECDSPFW